MPRVRQNARAFLAAVTGAALLLCLAPGVPAYGAGMEQSPFAAEAGAVPAQQGFARQLLRLQNAERRRHGLRRLRVSLHLRRASRRHARDMARAHYFGHLSRRGNDVVDRVLSTGYGGGMRFAVQENLFWWDRGCSAAEVVRAWMASPAHRANLLHGGWRHFGVGVVMRSPFGPGVTAVAVYGARLRR
jgi:uncharacterized protein YkwD